RLLHLAGRQHVQRLPADAVEDVHGVFHVRLAAEAVEAPAQREAVGEAPGIDAEAGVAEAAVDDRHTVDAAPVSFADAGRIVGTIHDDAVDGQCRRYAAPVAGEQSVDDGPDLRMVRLVAGAGLELAVAGEEAAVAGEVVGLVVAARADEAEALRDAGVFGQML